MSSTAQRQFCVGSRMLRVRGARWGLFLAAMATVMSSAAGQVIWDGGSGSTNYWSDAANWNNNVAPSNPSGSVLQFAGSTRVTAYADVATNALWAVNGLQFNSGAAAFTISSSVTGNLLGSGGIQVGSSGIVNQSSSAQRITSALTLSAGQTWQTTSTGALNIGSSRVDNGGFLLTTNAASATAINIKSSLSGTGGLTISGAGTTTLAGTNTYSGTTTLGATSILNLNSTSALGTGAFVINGGTIDNTSGAAITNLNNNAQTWAGNFTVTGTQNLNLGSGAVTLTGTRTATVISGTFAVDGSISGTGFGLVKAGTGALTLGGASSSWNGGVTLNAGTLNINNAAALGTGTFTIANGTRIDNTSGHAVTLTTTTPQTWNGDFAFTGTSNLHLGSGAVGLGGGTRTITTDAGTLTVGGVISNGGLIKAGAGALTLSANNTFASGLTLNAGTLNINANAALGTGTFTIAGGTIDNTSGTAVTMSNAQNWTGDFSFTGTNNLTMNTGAITLGGSRTVTVNGGTLAIGGVIGDGASTFGLTKNGTGTLTLSGANTFGGGTTGVTLNAGTLNIDNASALGAGAFTINGGTIDNTSGGALTVGNTQNWNGDFAFTGTNNLTMSGAVTLGTASSGTRTVTVNGGTLAISGAIGDIGTWGLTKAGSGTLTLAGANTFGASGGAGLTLNAGTLNINSSSALGAGTFTINGGTIDNTTGAAITHSNVVQAWNGDFAFTGTQNLNLGSGAVTLAGNRVVTVNNNTLTVGGNIGGSGFSLTKAGAGTLALAGASSYTGGTIINGGTLSLTGSLASGSALTFTGTGTFNRNDGGAQNLGALTLSAGDASIISTRTSGNVDLVFASNSRATGATATFTRSGGTASQNQITLTGQAAGFIDQGMFFNTGGASTFAYYDASGANVRGIVYGTDANTATVGAAATIGANSGKFVRTTGAISGQTSIAINTLEISGANNFTLAAGQTLTLTNGGLLKVGNNGATISGGSGIQPGSGTELVIRTDQANDSLTLSTPILANGSNAVTKSGAGTLVLNAANTHTGNLYLNAGTLDLRNANALGPNSGAGTFVINGGTLNNGSAGAITLSSNNAQQWNGDFGFTGTSSLNLGTGAVTLGGNRTVTVNANTLTVGGVIGDGGAGFGLTKAGAGTLALNAANTFSGSTTVTAGTIALGNSNALQNSDVTLSGGTLSLTGLSTATLGSLAGTSNLINNMSGNAALTVGGTNASTTYSGVLSGNGRLVKTGTGTFTLTGTNTYSGQTTIEQGTLSISSLTNSGTSSSIGAGSSINLGAGSSTGTLRYTGGTQTTNRNVNLTGTTGGGTIEASGTGALTFSSAIEVEAGAKSLTLSGTNVGDNTFAGNIINGSGTVSLVKSGVGTWVLSGTANTYSGGTTVNAGTLTVASGSSLGVSTAGNLTMNGGTLNLNNTAQTILALSGSAGTINLGSGHTLTINDTGSNTFAGVFGGTGKWAKTGSGTLTLSGASTNTGTVSISSGTVVVQNDTALGRSTGGGTTVASGATLNLNGTLLANNGTLTLAGTGVGGVGALVGTGSSANRWNGNLALSGNTTVSNTGSSYLALGAQTSTFSRGSDPAGPPVDNATLALGSHNLTLSGTNTIYLNARLTGTGNVTVNMTNSSNQVWFTSQMNTFTGTVNIDKGTFGIDNTVYNTVPNDPANPGWFALSGGLVIGNGSTTGGYDAIMNTPAGSKYDGLLNFNTPVTLHKDGRWDLFANQSIGPLEFNGGKIDLSSSGGLYLTGNVNVKATANETAVIDGTGVATGLSLTIHQNGSLVPNATRTFTVEDSSGVVSDLTINSKIFNGSIVKEGAGTMTVTSNNQLGYEGTTTINNGIYNIQHGYALGQGGTDASLTEVTANGTLQLQGGITVPVEKLVISGDGFLGGGSFQNLSGNNIWQGAVVSNSGTVQSQSGTLLTIEGTVTTNTGMEVRGVGDTTISGAIGGAGGLTKNGTGTLILSGSQANTYAGATTVNAGVLHIQKDTALGGAGTAASGTTVNSGAALYMSNNITTSNEFLTLNGSGIGNNGSLHNVSGTNTFGGTATLASASTITAAAGSSLTLRGITSSNSSSLTIGATGNTGTVTVSAATSSTFSGTVGQTHIAAGTFEVGGTGTTTLTTGEFSSASSTTLLIASGGTVNSVFDNGAITQFSGVIGSGSVGTFALTSGAGTSSGLQFNSTFTASGLTLKLGGATVGSSDLSNYFRLELAGVGITVGTIHITGDTILDFNGTAGTFLSSTNLIIDAGVKVQVQGWTSTYGNPGASTAWYVTNPSSGITGPGGINPISLPPTQFGTGVLPQITFADYNGLTTTWVSGNDHGWFNHEIRPTPEPATYGAILLGGCLGLVGWRRHVRRKAERA